MTTDDVENANAILADLVSKLAAANAQKDEAEAASVEHAYAAHTGDAKALDRLTKLTQKSLATALEIRGLEAAVAEARKRVEYAAAVAADAAERENARRADEILNSYAKRGAELDEAFERAVKLYQAMGVEYVELERLGYRPSNPDLVNALMRRAALTWLMEAKLTDYLPLPERRSFKTVVESWSSAVRGRIEARLKRSAPAKAA